jgi:hypothetical protein
MPWLFEACCKCATMCLADVSTCEANHMQKRLSWRPPKRQAGVLRLHGTFHTSCRSTSVWLTCRVAAGYEGSASQPHITNPAGCSLPP